MDDLDGLTTTENPKVSDGISGSRHIRSWQIWLGILWLIVLGLSVIILGVVVWNNRETLLTILKSARLEFFVLAAICYVLTNIVMALGWRTGLRAFNVTTSLWINFKIYFYTLAAKRVPGTIWYIAGRSVLYEKLGVPKRVISAVSGIEIVVSFLTGLIVGFPALLIYLTPSIFGALISIGLIICLSAALHPRVLFKIMGRFLPSVTWGTIRYRSMLTWAFWCSLMWIIGGLMTSSIVLALYNMDLSLVPLVITSWSLSGAISFVAFFLPHNFGITELSLTVLLGRIIPLPVAITVALTCRVLTTIIDVMFSFAYLVDRTFGMSR